MCAEKGWKIDPIGGGDSGHAMTGKNMGIVPLIPRNLSMVVDYNKIKQNITN